MSDAPEDHSLFFSDGCVVHREAVVIPAQYNEAPDVDVSRVMLKFGDQWVHYDVNDDMIRSVAYLDEDGRCYLMGLSGIIYSFGGHGRPLGLTNVAGTSQREVIADAEEYGELFRIRSIGGHVYACGQSSQVYRRAHGRWEHFDRGLLDLRASTLEDIGGTGPENLYAVGWGGLILRFDGQNWRRVDSPTNQHLSNIKIISNEEIYTCGNNGVLLRGAGEHWEFVGDPDFKANFWGMEFFNGKLYLAHMEGLLEFDGMHFGAVDFGVERKLTYYRLHANDGILWSFGINDLFCFDGQRWREVICPENVP
jgi:hypothetical protein